MSYKILVTGGNGQLGNELRHIHKQYPHLQFTFITREDLDVGNPKNVKSFFLLKKFDYVINCAAYTAVDNAEKEWIAATAGNVLAPRNLARACKDHGMKLIHISTDYVFDGSKNTPYTESDTTAPLNNYGNTKRKGELMIEDILGEYFILRTSWLYSSFGNNFVKTMLRLSDSKTELNIVNDQKGCPTYAADLAKGILQIIEKKSTDYGYYHFSNSEITTWDVFAKTIFELKNKSVKVHGIPTSEYPTPAKRSLYSAMDCSKFERNMDFPIRNWKDALDDCLKLL